MKIEIFTDGACSGNPGPGGYGILMRVPEKNYQKTYSKGFRKTTNNRMELLAVIVALEALKIEGSEVTVFTDSRYVADAVTKGWVFNWMTKRFKGKKNQDLWLRFLEVYKKHQVKFIWIKGHNDNPFNERCDEMAVAAAMQPGLPGDPGYQPE